MSEMSLKSIVNLEHMVFDKILFTRKGFKNSNSVNNELQVNINKLDDNDDKYRVTLRLNADKEDEYEIEIILSGMFRLENNGELDEAKKKILEGNMVAILMPYLRSEVSLLTAQPETDSLTLPVINVSSMMNNN